MASVSSLPPTCLGAQEKGATLSHNNPFGVAEGITGIVHQNVWFMHDGTLAYSIAVYNHFHAAYSGG
ncbi:hypothetical protein TNCV_1889261 [Trichonephila clavipes]|nr:hypothetical protein TNCV_1889261 [Trichonephila clavipes]